jgi:hypothetical protein
MIATLAIHVCDSEQAKTPLSLDPARTSGMGAACFTHDIDN